MQSLSRTGNRGLKSFLAGLGLTLFLLPSCIAQTESVKLSQVIDQLVLAYNNQDVKAYRKAFSEKLKSKFSPDRLKEIISASMKGNGPIISHKIELSPDQHRGLVFLEMEQGTFDVHFRVNGKSQIERLTWYQHKADPSVSALSGHEQHLVQQKYQPLVDKFIQAIRDTNAELMLSLMVVDDNDEWSLEDYQSFLVQMNERGVEKVGEVEVLGTNEILVPVYFNIGVMGFYLGFDKENKISSMRISNYAPNETKGLSYQTLGTDTLLTSDLKSFDQLREAFVSDSGKVRFITLLSPT